ncbi:MAG TPA: hypothetical protein VK633_01890 [Verrucomicrobiae bacterium]|nr:hypothetical protein [Verrucomicrobiae bacterium]
MAAPNSLQINPSAMQMISATNHPSSDCGPFSADMSSGIVMNGPTPIMLLMFRAVACSKPKRRCSTGAASGDGAIVLSMNCAAAPLPCSADRRMPITEHCDQR